jgi:hypothetical protein
MEPYVSMRRPGSLAWDKAGTDIAKWLNSFNVSAFILKYRVPKREWLPFGEAPLMDAQRAMGLVHSRAQSLQLNASRMGSILGFSAGGHLTDHLASTSGQFCRTGGRTRMSTQRTRSGQLLHYFRSPDCSNRLLHYFRDRRTVIANYRVKPIWTSEVVEQSIVQLAFCDPKPLSSYCGSSLLTRSTEGRRYGHCLRLLHTPATGPDTS